MAIIKITSSNYHKWYQTLPAAFLCVCDHIIINCSIKTSNIDLIVNVVSESPLSCPVRLCELINYSMHFECETKWIADIAFKESSTADKKKNLLL